MFLQSISLNEWKKSKEFTIKVPDHYQRSPLAQRFTFERTTMEKFKMYQWTSKTNVLNQPTLI